MVARDTHLRNFDMLSLTLVPGNREGDGVSGRELGRPILRDSRSHVSNQPREPL